MAGSMLTRSVLPRSLTVLHCQGSQKVPLAWNLKKRPASQQKCCAWHRVYSATAAPHIAKPGFQLTGNRMKAWQIHQYGGTEELRLTDTARVLPLKSPSDVLVAVQAASVNPVDVMMMGGYGANTINQVRCLQERRRTSEFPLILGRDFSGIVVETGRGVPASTFRPGDEVWGAGSAFRQGTHAQYHIVAANEICKKPVSLSHVEAASFPYVLCTIWAALQAAGMKPDRFRGRRVLLLGGSGGLGTLAIQMLKAWGAEVTCTCSASAISLVLECGADAAIDYQQSNVSEELHQIGGFDFILDTVSWSPYERLALLKKGVGAGYVSVANPLLRNNMQYGLPMGLVKSALELGSQCLKGAADGRVSMWAFFKPSRMALQTLAEMVEQTQIRAIVDAVFPFEEVPAAFEKVGGGHGRGKTIIDMKQLQDVTGS